MSFQTKGLDIEVLSNERRSLGRERFGLIQKPFVGIRKKLLSRIAEIDARCAEIQNDINQLMQFDILNIAAALDSIHIEQNKHMALQESALEDIRKFLESPTRLVDAQKAEVKNIALTAVAIQTQGLTDAFKSFATREDLETLRGQLPKPRPRKPVASKLPSEA